MSFKLLAIPPDPTEGLRDYGIASLDFKRVAGGLLVEDLDQVGLGEQARGPAEAQHAPET